MIPERVVYVLGAGFSQPLGLPVVRDFLARAKDLYFFGEGPRDHFRRVFEEVDKLARVKNYFDANLFNIEEILSILDMRAQVEGEELPADFRAFICDVIKGYTPTPPSGDTHSIFRNDPWSGYMGFTAALCGLAWWEVRSPSRNSHYGSKTDVPPTRYDVISLNYDCVLETAATTIRRTFMGPPDVAFCRTFDKSEQDPAMPRLIKLHGCVTTGEIVPPTWKKTVSGGMAAQWTAARDVLAKANHIRILGYSLPESDAYIRYLLKAAASEAPHLRAIDIITRANEPLLKRYQQFVSYPEARFMPANIQQYLWNVRNSESHVKAHIKGESLNCSVFDLEGVHERFMEGAALLAASG